MISDKYGRLWHFKPTHDTSQMLQISRNAAVQAYRISQFVAGTQTPRDPEWPEVVDVYLLKMGNGWNFGIRFGDCDADYFSPGLDPLAIGALLLHHRKTCSRLEYPAVLDLLGANYA